MHKGESVYSWMFNRNKRNRTLNLREDRDKEIFHGLAKFSGVVDDNFRPAVLENFRIDPETLEH